MFKSLYTLQRKVPMLRNKKHIFLCAVLLLSAGCANYKASSLDSISSGQAVQSSQNSHVTAAWKVFDKKDCLTYLGRDVLAKGYIPIQMTIKNQSDDPLYLSADQFNIDLIPPQQVANEVHTSTAARVVAWGVGGLLFGPLLIPAIYDGIKSSKANRSLDADYSSKALSECTIQPSTTFNGVFFVSKDKIHEPIEMFIRNERTQDKITFRVVE